MHVSKIQLGPMRSYLYWAMVHIFIRSKDHMQVDEKFQHFFDRISQVHINIPLVQAIKEMSGYAKFLKDMVSNKQKFEAYETINLFECSLIIQKKMPIKERDPECFTITCMIGGQTF